MSRPTIGVYCAFTNNPFVADSTLTWVDISDDVLLDASDGGGPITIRRGRQNELGRIEAGTLSLTLNNKTRKYDPENTASPYYPYIKPMKRIQVRATWAGFPYKLYTGYVQAWEPAYPGARQAVVQVRATDALSAIARSVVTVVAIPPGEFAHFAVRTALTLIGWPYLTDYVYSNGQTRIAPGTYANLNTLQYIQQICDTENALFFARGDGILAFQDRYYRINNATSLGTFGTQGSELPYEDVTLSFDEDLIYNDIQVTATGGTLQEAVDATSQAAYGPRLLSKSGLYFANGDTDALSMAQWLLLRYKDPTLRIPKIVLNGDLNSAIWTSALGRELSDKITVKVRPPGGGTITKDARIEAIQHDIARDAWRITWQLSMAGDDLFWKLDDPVRGRIDSVYKIAF